MTYTKKQQKALKESNTIVKDGFLRFDKANGFTKSYEFDPNEILYPEIPKERLSSWFAMIIRYMAAGYKPHAAYIRVKQYYPDLKSNTVNVTIRRLRKAMKGEGISFPPVSKLSRSDVAVQSEWMREYIFLHAGNPNFNVYTSGGSPTYGDEERGLSGEPSRLIGELTREEQVLLNEIRKAGAKEHERVARILSKASSRKKLREAPKTVEEKPKNETDLFAPFRRDLDAPEKVAAGHGLTSDTKPHVGKRYGEGNLSAKEKIERTHRWEAALKEFRHTPVSKGGNN